MTNDGKMVGHRGRTMLKFTRMDMCILYFRKEKKKKTICIRNNDFKMGFMNTKFSRFFFVQFYLFFSKASYSTKDTAKWMGKVNAKNKYPTECRSHA